MYVFLSEHKDGSMIEIESWDAKFLKEEFSSKGVVSWDSDLHKLDKSAPNCLVEQEWEQ